jgi:DNA invertase Pin-like site-specific DNA recombinase
MTRTALYARSSPDCSLSADQQIDELMRIAAVRGWAVEHVFKDHPTSVKKGQDRRPGELTLIDAIRSGTVERVLVWSVCRIGKSLTELASLLETCRAASVTLYLHQEKIDSAETNGLSLFDVSKLLAVHIRQGHRDRILRGQAAARALNVRFGRPPLGKAKVERAKQLLSAGKGVREVARLTGISAAACSRLKNSLRSVEPHARMNACVCPANAAADINSPVATKPNSLIPHPPLKPIVSLAQCKTAASGG